MRKSKNIFKAGLIPPFCGCIALCVIIALYSGCSLNADRENPLDPKSPFYKPTSGLTGRITSFGDNPKGLSNVQVLLNPGAIATVSDDNGYFSFTDLEPGLYDIILQREYLKSIDSTVNIPPENLITANFSMNFLPLVDSLSLFTLRTINISTEFGEYEIFLNAVISDSDGTENLSDSAVVYWLNHADKVMFADDISQYSRLFTHIIDVEGTALNDYLGLSYYLQANDSAGDTVKSALVYVVRFIEEPMLAFTPSGIDTTGGKPLFTWHDPTVAFDYKYRLKLYTYPSPVQIFEEVLYDTSEALVEVDIITNTLGYIYKSFSPNDSLSLGQYMWTVQIEDLIGNISRSKQKIFEVQ